MTLYTQISMKRTLCLTVNSIGLKGKSKRPSNDRSAYKYTWTVCWIRTGNPFRSVSKACLILYYLPSDSITRYASGGCKTFEGSLKKNTSHDDRRRTGITVCAINETNIWNLVVCTNNIRCWRNVSRIQWVLSFLPEYLYINGKHSTTTNRVNTDSSLAPREHWSRK